MSVSRILNHDTPVVEQIQECISSIRREPAAVTRRVALAQLYMAVRDWQKAADQLERAAQLAPACIPLATAYREAIRCEMFRDQVFAGARVPSVSDAAPRWLNSLASALHQQALGELEQAAQIRAHAFAEAETCRFHVDEQPATWLADADSRLGPVCELFMHGQYHWIPFTSIATLAMEAPVDLRDLFWAPCSVQLLDGQAFHALLPCRYPADQSEEEDDLLLGRRTQWRDLGADTWIGGGQKILIGDDREFPILTVRSIVNMGAGRN